MFNSNTTPFTMPVAPTGTNNGMFGDNGAWWIIILFVLIFGGWGNGFGGSQGAANNYVLTSDFSQLSRQLADSTSMTERKLDSVNNGICSLGYDQLGQMNGINTNILTQANATNSAMMQGFNALSSQFSDCCCQNRYDALVNANATQNLISNGFCQTNFNNQTNTRDIVDAQNINTQTILEKLNAMEASAKDDKIAELTAKNADLRLAASQSAQNNYLIGALRPTPTPAYVVANPYGCNCGQTYAGYYGTTIA